MEDKKIETWKEEKQRVLEKYDRIERGGKNRTPHKKHHILSNQIPKKKKRKKK